MKKACCAAFFLMLLAQPAFADWKSDFAKNFDEFGLERAVENALADDINANEILIFVLQNQNTFNTKLSMKALYCAGVPRDEVQESASKLKVPADEISKALEESIQECGSKLALKDRDVLELSDNGSGTPPVSAPAAAPQQVVATPSSSSSGNANPSPSNP